MAEVKESSILIQDVETKNIMTKSTLPVGGYSVNPYVGCTHGCKYCYASFMKRFTGHTEPWGTFLDVKHWLEDLFKKAEEKGEAPFFILCDEIEDPHNLGAIIRTANLAGAHGVIIPKRRAVGLTSTVAKVSAGALNYTPVARVTNLSRTIDELKDKGMWFVCGDMGGELMYDLNLTGSIGLIIGNEGNGVSRLVKEKCDYVASIPMKGDIDSLNASVATGVLAFEIVRQRMGK